MRARSSLAGLLAILAALALGLLCGSGFAVPQDTPPRINEYRIGPSDLLEIKVFELPEFSQTVRVSEDGTITFALLGKVDVARLTAQELERKLAALLDEKWLKAAHVTVFIREFQKVSIMGAVSSPGMYELAGEMTLLKIISLAGGLTAEAMSELHVYRTGPDGERTRLVIDLNDLVRNGNQSLNLALQPKDEIVVPVDSLITLYVYGEVKSPGMLRPRLSANITLLKAIAQAGGTTDWALKSRVTVTRTDPKTGKETMIILDLNAIVKGRTKDLRLQDGDIIIVPEKKLFR